MRKVLAVDTHVHYLGSFMVPAKQSLWMDGHFRLGLQDWISENSS